MWDYKQKLNSIFSEKVCCETLAVNKLRHDLYKLEGIVLRRFGTGQEIFRTVLMHQYSEFFVFLFTCILLEFRLFSNCDGVGCTDVLLQPDFSNSQVLCLSTGI